MEFQTDGEGVLLWNGGLPDVFMVRAEDQTCERFSSNSFALGVIKEVESRPNYVNCRPGDRFVVFSDGITEAESRDGEMYGEERVEALFNKFIAEPQCIFSELLEDVLRFRGGGQQSDDTTMVEVLCAKNLLCESTFTTCD